MSTPKTFPLFSFLPCAAILQAATLIKRSCDHTNGHVLKAFDCCTKWRQEVTSFLEAHSSKTFLRFMSNVVLGKAPEAALTSAPPG